MLIALGTSRPDVKFEDLLEEDLDLGEDYEQLYGIRFEIHQLLFLFPHSSCTVSLQNTRSSSCFDSEIHLAVTLEDNSVKSVTGILMEIPCPFSSQLDLVAVWSKSTPNFMTIP